ERRGAGLERLDPSVAVVGGAAGGPAPARAPVRAEGGGVAVRVTGLLEDEPLGQLRGREAPGAVGAADHGAEGGGAAGALEGPQVLLPAAVVEGLRLGAEAAEAGVQSVARALGVVHVPVRSEEHTSELQSRF